MGNISWFSENEHRMKMQCSPEVYQTLEDAWSIPHHVLKALLARKATTIFVNYPVSAKQSEIGKFFVGSHAIVEY